MKKNRVPIILVIVFICLLIVGNWQIGQALKHEKDKNQALTERLKQQEVTIANAKESSATSNKTSSTVEKTVTDSTKNISSNLAAFLQNLYASKNKNLEERYKKISPFLTGDAVNQLKPSGTSDSDSQDDGYTPTTISDIQTFNSGDSKNQEAVTFYKMENKVGDTTKEVNMIMRTKLVKSGQEWLISKIEYNTGYEPNGSN
ncbi:hypothetical protein [Liquorilactobacillus mali]|uniref:Uncharacterized protein n=1 Tax=Liquorilactobacillus mali KCTC 3596 = DSM 20444 TaxID=1046596 RepID=J0L097_9LACO|nr:hypothetical protein [Liquorilactobacillus mali]EJF00685.1 hypothetical protein LMA_03034 [Liquorilactobacillus mali KCTC 3596 = DSM 20444]KRN08937.1 hypothetical protein FD00_GL001645 [Liquorilactobacillus mali KCTC 3596 = DSM 20444]MDC7954078.1 hypothetical protein [Liquorilactobacillus mali]QFQ75728.1 hypothetical protein LM596_11845 [Liquorilactobacillus mali]